MSDSCVLCSSVLCLISVVDLTFDRCAKIDHQLVSGEGLLLSRSFALSKTDVLWSVPSEMLRVA